MKKFLVIMGLLGSAALLTACDEDQLQMALTRYNVVIAPDSMYNCPVVTKWPKINTLSDLQVARLVVQLAENNRICKTSLDSIKAYYATAKLRIEAQNPPVRSR